MEHSPGLPQDTKFLRSCSRNQAKMLFKGQFGMKCHSQYNKVIRLLQYNWGCAWGCIVRDLETIIVLVLLAINFIPQRSHHSLTLPRSRIRDSATLTLTPGDGTTAIKVVISITDQLIFQIGKKAPECTEGTITGPKHCPAALLKQPQPVVSDNHPL